MVIATFKTYNNELRAENNQSIANKSFLKGLNDHLIVLRDERVKPQSQFKFMLQINKYIFFSS